MPPSTNTAHRTRKIKKLKTSAAMKAVTKETVITNFKLSMAKYQPPYNLNMKINLQFSATIQMSQSHIHKCYI